jgi:hypothetical protein
MPVLGFRRSLPGPSGGITPALGVGEHGPERHPARPAGRRRRRAIGDSGDYADEADLAACACHEAFAARAHHDAHTIPDADHDLMSAVGCRMVCVAAGAWQGAESGTRLTREVCFGSKCYPSSA